MAYLLDANVFIQAKNLHYGFDFCPAFWEWIVRENAAGRVFSIERVGDELKAGADELAQWAGQRGSGLFLVPDASMLGALPQVSAWVTLQSYSAAAVNTFLQVADYYLVARAVAGRDVVVGAGHVSIDSRDNYRGSGSKDQASLFDPQTSAVWDHNVSMRAFIR